MRASILAATAALAVQARAADICPDVASHFTGAQYFSSAGGNANCVSGLIAVNVSTKAENIKLAMPENQAALSEFFVEALQINSTIANTTNGGLKQVTGTYNIKSTLCLPKSGNASSTIQFLTHGLNFDQFYWDIAPNYSYIDAAALAGYPTFSYDRLGTGDSDHPDPIQIVQSFVEREVAHQLVTIVRKGFGSEAQFNKTIGVGHSYGSVITVGIAAVYPKDFDALILTGFSLTSTGQPLSFAAANPAIASINDPKAFAGLASGYYVLDSPIGNQIDFFRYPTYTSDILNLTYAHKQPYSLGEYLTSPAIIAPSPNFTGPVDVLNGENDFIFCQGNCALPVDQAARVLASLYPKASKGSQHLLLKGTGHGINAHTTAPQAFQQMIGFARSNGL